MQDSSGIVDIGCALTGLEIVDLACGMAPAQVSKLLAELGARVHRFEPASGDPFERVYPAYATWHQGAERIVVPNAADARIDDALATADACIIGGEDFPGRDWHFDAALLSARFPSLVILEIEGYPADFRGAPSPAVVT